MRVFLALLFGVAGFSVIPAHADPYRWCAVLEGSSTCYFVTLDQCRATVNSVNGFCTPNGFYDGRPTTTPAEFVRSRRSRR